MGVVNHTDSRPFYVPRYGVILVLPYKLKALHYTRSFVAKSFMSPQEDSDGEVGKAR